MALLALHTFITNSAAKAKRDVIVMICILLKELNSSLLTVAVVDHMNMEIPAYTYSFFTDITSFSVYSIMLCGGSPPFLALKNNLTDVVNIGIIDVSLVNGGRL